MMSFIHCFAQKSNISHRIDPNTTEGAHDKENLTLAPKISPKDNYRFRSATWN